MKPLFAKDSRGGHSRLRGGQAPLPHKFNSWQMKSLAAICETFVPFVQVDEVGLSSGANETSKKSRIDIREASAKGSADDLAEFYRLSAADFDVPARAAGMAFRVLRPDLVRSVGHILWLMNTFLGTLLLFGTMSLSWRYPFFLSFTRFSPEQREKAMLRWESSKVGTFSQLYKLFKIFSVYLFYSGADESGHNPIWRAIGFCGAENSKSSESETCASRPLEGKVLEIRPESASEENLANFLADGGFSLLNAGDISKLRSSVRGVDKRQLEIKREIGVKCDALVIGSGAGGGVVAGALAQAGHKVLILEKGAYYARNDYTLLEGPSFAEMYEDLSALTTDDARVNIQAGSVVGGGSAVNWAASFRTPDHVRREWAKVQGLSFFATEEYERAMDKVCERGSVNSLWKKCSFQNQILTRGCESLRFPLSEVPRNVLDEHDCGRCHLGCRTGSKQATTETWLVDAVEAGSLIVANCTVQEVLYRDSESGGSGKEFTAMGAMASWGQDVNLYVDSKVTVLCGGALNTPTVLLRSGLKNPSIGRNLRLHPVVMCWGYFPEDKERETYSGTCYEGAILTAVSSQSANWASSGYGTLMEVPILSPGSWAAISPWEGGLKHKRRMKKYSRTARFIILVRDQGAGRVGLHKDGCRRLTYNLDSRDEENLMEGLQNGLRVMRAAGAEEIGTLHGAGRTFSRRKSGSGSSTSSSPEVDEEAEFEEYLKEVRAIGFEGIRTPLTSAHQMGSCRMGVSRESSVVNSSGESWEVDGLFLGDSSVFPTSSGVNPMITVQSVALCIAQNIITKLQGAMVVREGS